MFGHPPEACIRREILEETGYQVPQVERVLEAYSSPGAVTERMYLYLAAYSPEMKVSEGGGVAQETEDIELVEYGYSEVLQLLAEGQILDAKSLMLVQHAALYGPLREAFLNSGPAPR